MRLFVAHFVVFTIGLSFWLCIPCTAQKVRGISKQALVHAASKVVEVNLDNEAGGLGNEPLQALSKALLSHAGARFFRVTWDCDFLSLSSRITVLYNRRKKTIGYYCSGGHNMGGNPAEVVYDHYLYTGVTEKIIHQASGLAPGPFPNAIRQAPTYKGSGTPGGYYDNLLTFGCHRKKLP